jgi:hypothetical protein
MVIFSSRPDQLITTADQIKQNNCRKNTKSSETGPAQSQVFISNKWIEDWELEIGNYESHREPFRVFRLFCGWQF